MTKNRCLILLTYLVMLSGGVLGGFLISGWLSEQRRGENEMSDNHFTVDHAAANDQHHPRIGERWSKVGAISLHLKNARITRQFGSYTKDGRQSNLSTNRVWCISIPKPVLLKRSLHSPSAIGGIRYNRTAQRLSRRPCARARATPPLKIVGIAAPV